MSSSSLRRSLVLLASCVPFMAGAWAADQKSHDNAFQAGVAPPDELGKDLEGKQVRVSDYRGKVVIVSFWASWCGPCKQELPVLAGVVKRVGPEHLQIVAINFQDERKPFEYVVNVLKDFPIRILRDSGGRTASKYNVHAIPRLIFIDREGKVASDHTGYGESSIPEFVAELNRLLAQQT